MNTANDIEDILSLVEQNFVFLHVGEFLSKYIKRNNLSLCAEDILMNLEDDKSFRLRKEIIRDSLRAAALSKKPNIVGYYVEWNAVRGICMAMREGLKDESTFKTFVEKKLGSRYGHWQYILTFVRNVLSHNIDNEIRLKKTDYEGTKKKVMQKNDESGIAKFTFDYNTDISEVCPKDYKFTIEVDFASMKPGDRFLDIISEWHLLMFSELCFNLVKLFRKEEAR